jgi:hypothetical protein
LMLGGGPGLSYYSQKKALLDVGHIGAVNAG